MKKRLLSTFMALLMVCSLVIYLPTVEIRSYARVNGTANFNRNYSLSGNGASDIITVAFAQLGRNGGSLGYSAEEWCADFVSDCAILANQQNAIPTNARCTDMYDAIIRNGGRDVSPSEAIPGDIVFENNFDHVGIVYEQPGNTLSSLRTIEGNTGNSNNSLSVVNTFSNKSKRMKVVRPNYSGSNFPGPEDTSYNVPVTVYATHDINEIYSNSNGSLESGRYISNGDKCYVDHVYKSGLCHVKYPSGGTEPNRWAYCKASELPLTRGCTCSESYAGTYEVTTSQYPLTIRSGHGTSYEDIGKIPKGAHCTVTKADGSWAHVEYNGVSGFASMEYLRKINTDTTKPIISNVKVTDVSVNGYTVTCTVTDNVGIDRVQFPTWTLANDQDDIQPSWGDNPSARGTKNGNTVTYRVNRTDHKKEFGTYRTHIYAYDTSGNWTCVAVNDVNVGVGKAMSSGAGQTIPDGDYIIVSELGRRIYLDIPGVEYPSVGGVDIAICEGSTLPDKSGLFDTWTVKYLNNGYYKITQKGTDISIDVKNDSLVAGTEIMTCKYHGGNNQQWSIKVKDDHGYTIQSRSTSWILDVRGANTATGTKVQVWEENGNKAQHWCFIPIASDDRPIADGEYKIKSACGDVYLDASGYKNTGDYKNGTNIAIALTNNDSFKITYVGDGYYTLCEATTGLAVEVEDSDKTTFLNRKNIQLGSYTGERRQLWKVVNEGNGMYRFVSKLSGYSLDLAGMKTANGSNIQQHPYNTSNAQKWSFEKVHKPTATAAKAATCTADGNTAYWHCSGCKKYFSDSACTKEITLASTIIKANGHSFGDWTVTEAATCAAEGTKSRKCTVCGKTETTSIAKATTHSFGSWTTTKAATCAVEGTKTHKCSVCGKTETASIAKTTDHKFGDWTVTKAATCAAEGTKTRKCSICGKTENQTIPKSNKHKYKVETIPPTTTEGGYDRHNCTLCGHFYIDNVVPPISVPDNPTVSYEKGDGSVKLTWNTVSGAQKYGIAGYQNGAWQLLDKTTGSSYTLKNLKAGTNYKVAVIAMFNSNWNMDFSSAITVTPNGATVSQYPVVQTQVKDSKIGFKWNKIPGVEKYGIGMYQANKWKVIKQLDGNVTTWTSPQISSGKYRLAVLAKVNGQWVNADVFKKSFYVTVE